MEKIVEYITIKEDLSNQINKYDIQNKVNYYAELPVATQGNSAIKSKEKFKHRSCEPKLTLEDKMKALKEIETFKSNYFKGQFCSYWIRGVCWIPKEKCQFAHGIDDLIYENFVRLSENRKENIVDFGEIANNIQTFRILINKNYFLLHEFINENKHKIPELHNLNYSLEEINRSSKLRSDIRKLLLQKVFNEFIELVFKKKYEIMKQNNPVLFDKEKNNIENEREEIIKNVFFDPYEFEQMIKSVGLKINDRTLSQSKILKKNFVDKHTKKKKSIIRLMPDTSDLLQNFVKIIINDFKKMKADDLRNAFPLNFKFINQLIIKNIAQEEPYIFNYMNAKNVSYSEFMEELKNEAYLIENLDLLVAEKNKELINLNPNSELIAKENYFHEENIDDIVNEFRAFMWEKYFKKLESENYSQKYGFMSYEFIRENFFNFANKKISYHISDNVLNLIIKKILLFDKNLFFINNNNKNYVINFNHFQGLKLSAYFQEGKFDKRCNILQEKVQILVQDHFNAEKGSEEENEAITEAVSVFNILEDKILSFIKTNKENNFDNVSNLNEDEISEECKSQEIPINDNYNSKNNSEESHLQFNKGINYAKEEIVVIDDFSSLLYFIRKSKNFKLIAVDLEGRLNSKSANINLIQIFDDFSKQIFILDVYKICHLEENKKETLFECLQIIFTFIMENECIIKVFHDGRKDIAALHCFFKCCTSNFIDTSCIYSFIKQLDLQTEFYNINYGEKIKLMNTKNKSSKNAKADLFYEIFFNNLNDKENNNNNNNKNDKNSNSPKNINNNVFTFNNFNYTTNHQISDIDIANMHSLINNSSSPGLNKVLEAYEPNGNVNYLKDKMHGLMGSLSMKHKLFTNRPIDKDFLIYSAMDVKFLISSLKNMQEELKNKIIAFYPDAKTLDLELICRVLSNGHMKSYCSYE